jgi:hypothetical protein
MLRSEDTYDQKRTYTKVSNIEDVRNWHGGRNGVDTDVYPNRRKREFKRMAQNF